MSRSTRNIGIAFAALATTLSSSSWGAAEPEIVVHVSCPERVARTGLDAVRREVLDLYHAATADQDERRRAAEITLVCEENGSYSVVVTRPDDPEIPSRVEEGFATYDDALKMAVPIASVLLLASRPVADEGSAASETNSIIPPRTSEPSNAPAEVVSEPDRASATIVGRADSSVRTDEVSMAPVDRNVWSWSASASGVAATGATKEPTAGARLGVRGRVDNVSVEVQAGGDLATEVNQDTIASRLVATAMGCGHRDPAFGCLTASTGVIRRGEGGTTIADKAGPFAAVGVRVGLETKLFWRLSWQASGGLDVLLTDIPAADASRVAGIFSLGLVTPISF